MLHNVLCLTLYECTPIGTAIGHLLDGELARLYPKSIGVEFLWHLSYFQWCFDSFY